MLVSRSNMGPSPPYVSSFRSGQSRHLVFRSSKGAKPTVLLRILEGSSLREVSHFTMGPNPCFVSRSNRA